MASIITFAAQGDGFSKRKRVYRACEDCKKRRKRCSHTFDGKLNATDPASSPGLSTNMSRPEKDEPQHRTPANLSDHSQGPSVLLESVAKDVTYPTRTSQDGIDLSVPSLRFVGFASPEAILRSQLRSSHLAERHQVGYWIQLTDEEREQSRSDPVSNQDTDERILTVEDSAIKAARAAYLETVKATLLPPTAHLEALLDIYFTSIQPILPILEKGIFMKQYKAGKASCMLLQTICIVVSKHDQAREHLYLSDTETPLLPRLFAQRLFTSVMASLSLNQEKDRIVLMQTLAIISLYSEGPSGAEQASIHLAQAIHHAHTFGMHLIQEIKTPTHRILSRLFWCLWCLDKLNGAMNGRPLMIHDRDNSPKVVMSDDDSRTPFRVLFELSKILDRVTSYYRPIMDPANTGWEDDFPGFEDVLGEYGDQFDLPTIAVLELYYHAASILSCRSRSVTEPIQSTPSYTRQSLSAVRVMSILGHECPTGLPPLPIVPFSLALAMFVAYRQFRQSKLPIHRDRAKKALRTCCSLLNRLRTVWWAAGAMADLGRAALGYAERGPRPGRKSGQSQIERGVIGMTTAAAGAVATSNSSGILPASGSPTGQEVSVLGPDLDASFPWQQEAVSIDTPRSTGMLNGKTDIPDLPLESMLLTPGSGWLEFDAAFENIDALLGSGGPALSEEMLRPFNFDMFDAEDVTNAVEANQGMLN